MFLLRSVFWLTVAFVLIGPDVDMGQAASDLSNQAMARGSQFVAAQIEGVDCDSITCSGGKALAVAALNTASEVGAPMHVLPASPAVPLPRPRPDRPV